MSDCTAAPDCSFERELGLLFNQHVRDTTRTAQPSPRPPTHEGAGAHAWPWCRASRSRREPIKRSITPHICCGSFDRLESAFSSIAHFAE